MQKILQEAALKEDEANDEVSSSSGTEKSEKSEDNMVPG